MLDGLMEEIEKGDGSEGSQKSPDGGKKCFVGCEKSNKKFFLDNGIDTNPPKNGDKENVGEEEEKVGNGGGENKGTAATTTEEEVEQSPTDKVLVTDSKIVQMFVAENMWEMLEGKLRRQ